MNLQRGLVGHWTMDDADTSGGTLYDRSAYDNHGTLNGTISTGSVGQVGESFTFGGLNSGDWIDIDGLGNPIDGPYTCSVWVYPTALDVDSNNNYRNVLTKGDSGNIILLEEYGAISFRPSGGGGNFTAGSVNTNEWSFVTVVWDGSDRLIYKNGVEQGRETSGTSPSITSIAFSDSGSDHQFAGRMDNFYIHERVLSVNEINALYQMRSQRNALI